MEREELELIMRLKNTRLLEEQAHHQLESAKNDPLAQASVQQSTTSSKMHKSAGKSNSRAANRN